MTVRRERERELVPPRAGLERGSISTERLRAPRLVGVAEGAGSIDRSPSVGRQPPRFIIAWPGPSVMRAEPARRTSAAGGGDRGWRGTGLRGGDARRPSGTREGGGSPRGRLAATHRAPGASSPGSRAGPAGDPGARLVRVRDPDG